MCFECYKNHLEDDDQKEVNVNGEMLTFTPQLIKN